LFMGGEFGQSGEWSHDRQLDWWLLDYPLHQGVSALVADLNAVYRDLPALHQLDCSPDGFRWLEGADAENSVFAYARFDENRGMAIVLVNMTPVPRNAYRIGVPQAGEYRERINTDSAVYGGTNLGNGGGVTTEPVSSHGYDQSLVLCLPPLATLVFEFMI